MNRFITHFSPLLALLIATVVAISTASSVRPRCLVRSGMGNGLAFARRRALISGRPPVWN